MPAWMIFAENHFASARKKKNDTMISIWTAAISEKVGGAQLRCAGLHTSRLVVWEEAVGHARCWFLFGILGVRTPWASDGS